MQSPGSLIAKYLQKNKNGATTFTDIVQHLQDEHLDACNQSSEELSRTLESILADAATLRFLERKGSRFMHWVVKEMSRMSRGCCRRPCRRRIRRRRRSRRRRRRCPRRRRRRCRCR
ncbi:jg7851 [Pararge aegeria aegeria]|uniref:Jg7851 protein n=1 Tax=Pararge aegeria aegeria TaxID=348720 RepID=A0A8S4RNR8_9NEOP|nr:jg7851 [Pararge aegeria aegeria]